MNTASRAILISLTTSLAMVGLATLILNKYVVNVENESVAASKNDEKARDQKISARDSEISPEPERSNNLSRGPDRLNEAIRSVNEKISGCLVEYREEEDRRYDAEQARAENEFVNSTRGMSWNQMETAYGILAASVQRQKQMMENDHILNYRRIYQYCDSTYPCPDNSERETNSVYCALPQDQ